MTERAASEFRLTDPATMECPYPFYRALYEGVPVQQEDGLGLLVAGHADVTALSLAHGLFSSSIAADGKGPRHMGIGADPVQDDVEELLAAAHPVANALFTADPPLHTRHRALVNKAFSARRIRLMRASRSAAAHRRTTCSAISSRPRSTASSS